MKTAILNGFSCGIVTKEELPIEKIESARREWTENGMICWISKSSRLYNQEALDAGYSKNTPNQSA